MEDINNYVIHKAALAKEAAKILRTVDTEIKNSALIKMADAIIENTELIIKANSLDIKLGEEKGLSKALLDRLLLNQGRIEAMAEGLRQIAIMDDPIGEVKKMWKRPNGLLIGQMKVPLGVIGIIYEARPNVTADAAALCIKTGNAVVLKGGSEAIESNIIITKILREACEKAGLPKDSISILDTADREAVNVMLKLNKYIDVIIPRGSGNLINFVVNNSTVPVIQTGEGNCHIYVDEDADIKMALDIIVNAKTQRPAVCNAAETLLVHKKTAEIFIPKVLNVLSKYGVEIRACKETLDIVNNSDVTYDKISLATDVDYNTEFLDLILAVKIVDSLEDAINHIYKYSTGHSEVIVTNNYTSSQKFLKEIDSAAVYVNASSRFTDGFEFGFGGEIGISTQKLHARGPMGLNELTSTKYVIYGSGQIRK